MSKRAERAALKVYPKSDFNGVETRRKGNRKCFIGGYERAEQETIGRACNWLFSHLPILVVYYNEDIHEKADRSEFIKLFRTQMEEQ